MAPSNGSIWVILPIVLFLLFSCSSTKQQKINVREAEVFYNRGVAYAGNGEKDQAVDDFTKAIELNPRLAEAYYNRGVIYAEKGQLDQAISD
jgi:tetratricopeptide (TPR) repeat protein